MNLNGICLNEDVIFLSLLQYYSACYCRLGKIFTSGRSTPPPPHHYRVISGNVIYRLL